MTTDQLKALVRRRPGLPDEGIIFKDLMPLIGNAAAFRLHGRAARGVGASRETRT